MISQLHTQYISKRASSLLYYIQNEHYSYVSDHTDVSFAYLDVSEMYRKIILK